MNTAPLLEAHAVTIETPGGRALVRDLNLHLGRERVALSVATALASRRCSTC